MKSNPIITISITVDSDSQINQLHKIDNNQAYFNIFDERYKDGKKKALSLKNQYGAQINPFIEVKINDKFYSMIYSEDTSNPIKKLEKVLKEIDNIKNTLST